MTTATMTPGRTLIEGAKGFAQSTKDRLLHIYSFVPADKVHYKPAETSKSALEILAHVAIANKAFAMIIKRQMSNAGSAEEIFAKLGAEEKQLTTDFQVKATLEETHTLVINALDALTDEDVFSQVETPVMNGPMTFFMNLPGIHYTGHCGQIEYLQTIWGDLDYHFN